MTILVHQKSIKMIPLRWNGLDLHVYVTIFLFDSLQFNCLQYTHDFINSFGMPIHFRDPVRPPLSVCNLTSVYVSENREATVSRNKYPEGNQPFSQKKRQSDSTILLNLSHNANWNHDSNFKSSHWTFLCLIIRPEKYLLEIDKILNTYFVQKHKIF